jgi:hypothetical protein
MNIQSDPRWIIVHMRKFGGMDYGLFLTQSADFFSRLLSRHRDLMKYLYGEYCPAFVRQGYPIVVDKDAPDSVVEAPSPDAWTDGDYLRTMAYVNVLDMQWFDVQDEPDNGIGSEVGWTRVWLICFILDCIRC